MLPEYSFLFDGKDEEAEYDKNDKIPYAPVIQSHIHPADFFMIQINDHTRYIGQYVSICSKKRVPIWQQSSVLSYGDSLALFRIFPTHQQLSRLNVEAHLLRVPLEDLSKCIGLQQVFRSNSFIWVPMNQIVDVVFISHADNVQNSFLQFGG